MVSVNWKVKHKELHREVQIEDSEHVSCYLAMNSIFPLRMKKVHKMASLVRLMDKFNSLNNQIRA